MLDQAPIALLFRRTKRRFLHLLQEAADDTTFRRWYRILALFVLFGTTVVWSILGARLHAYNADQLSDPYLFSTAQTFHDASFPGAHTFLLKWPIFWLVSVFGVSATSLTVATTIVTLLTVGALAAVLYTIDRRPLVFGTVCLGLSLVLLLIPTQPYAGALLPVNMAMLTTRNLEYAFYLIALVYLARTQRLRSLKSGIGIFILAVLIASDKLFLSLSAGGALLALVVYVLFANWALATYAVRWLVSSCIAAALAMAGLFAIAALHITHLVNGAAATPYGFISTAQQASLGTSYAALGYLTNLGANPVYDNRVISQLPSELVGRMWSIALPIYVVALLLAGYAVWQIGRVLLPSLKRSQQSQLPAAQTLALSLIWSTAVSIVVFVATDHYFPVDARYLSIGFFATAVATSVSLRKRFWQRPADLLLVASFLTVGIIGAVFVNIQRTHTQLSALSEVNQRNATVTAMLSQHKVDVLVGDYWRVMPIKYASGGTQKALPLGTCTDPYQVLTSMQWQPDLRTHSFAYLVTLDGSVTNFPDCSLAQITTKYGKPNATQIVAGTYAKPTEALLFYDAGSRPTSEHVGESLVPTLPVSLEQLPNTNCSEPTTMNIVAHPDDDLLFMNPDILTAIDTGRCVRTMFLTAGDAGNGAYYWLNRQRGSQAAYASMLGDPGVVWDEQTTTIAKDQYVTIATPRGHPKISLIFFDLPDGGLFGHGFETSHGLSLGKLHSGEVNSISSVDGHSHYTAEQLRKALTTLMGLYRPATVNVQGEKRSLSFPDHSDHLATGHFAEEATQAYDRQYFGDAIKVPVVRYLGYPIREFPSNIAGEDLAKKEAAFLAYAAYDGTVCHTLHECYEVPTYGSYLTRQYSQ